MQSTAEKMTVDLSLKSSVHAYPTDLYLDVSPEFSRDLLVS